MNRKQALYISTHIDQILTLLRNPEYKIDFLQAGESLKISLRQAEQYLERIEFIKAFAEGKTVQHYSAGAWDDLNVNPYFDGDKDHYRIKPAEPQEFTLIFSKAGYPCDIISKGGANIYSTTEYRHIKVREIQ